MHTKRKAQLAALQIDMTGVTSDVLDRLAPAIDKLTEQNKKVEKAFTELTDIMNQLVDECKAEGLKILPPPKKEGVK